MINSVLEYIKISFEINPIGQIIGFIAFTLGLLAKLHKNDNKTKSIEGVSLIFFVIHYYIFGLYTGLVSDLIGSFRNFLSIKYRKNINVLIILFIIYGVAGYITYVNIYSIFPIISGLIATSAYFYLKGIKMRLVILITSFLWVIYNYFGHSLGGMTADIFFMCGNLTTIFRLLLDKKKIK